MRPEILGNIVLGASAILALIVSLDKLVSGPIQQLSITIAAFSEQVKSMTKDIEGIEKSVKEQEAHDRVSHERMWKKSDEQDARLNSHEIQIGDHERRISDIEKDKR